MLTNCTGVTRSNYFGALIAAQNRDGMGRLLAFLDIDPHSDEGLRVRTEVLKIGLEVQKKRQRGG